MPKTTAPKDIAPLIDEEERIFLGEFWVTDGELWTDPMDPETGFYQSVQFDRIKRLQKKLQAGKALNIATRYSNRRPLG